jgi:hypothetical protein
MSTTNVSQNDFSNINHIEDRSKTKSYDRQSYIELKTRAIFADHRKVQEQRVHK